MKRYQDRCDICGRFVEECGLVWVDSDYTVAACKKCADRLTPLRTDAAEATAGDGAEQPAAPLKPNG